MMWKSPKKLRDLPGDGEGGPDPARTKDTLANMSHREDHQRTNATLKARAAAGGNRSPTGSGRYE